MIGKIVNGQIVYPPVNDGNNMNVYKDPIWLQENGFHQLTQQDFDKINAKKQQQFQQHRQLMKQFWQACQQFKAVCKAIGTLIGKQDFKGGFDQMVDFESSEASKSQEGIMLAIKWSAADKYCTYTAKKAGYGQPDWWYLCWNIKK